MMNIKKILFLLSLVGFSGIISTTESISSSFMKNIKIIFSLEPASLYPYLSTKDEWKMGICVVKCERKTGIYAGETVILHPDLGQFVIFASMVGLGALSLSILGALAIYKTLKTKEKKIQVPKTLSDCAKFLGSAAFTTASILLLIRSWILAYGAHDIKLSVWKFTPVDKIPEGYVPRK